jgi:hypothetical protein
MAMLMAVRNERYIRLSKADILFRGKSVDWFPQYRKSENPMRA